MCRHPIASRTTARWNVPTTLPKIFRQQHLNWFYPDASALVKRYSLETGTDFMDQLFDTLLPLNPTRLVCSRIDLGEVIAALNRKKNAGIINENDFTLAYAKFLDEIYAGQIFPVTDNLLDASISHILDHNINATDAIHLQTVLEIHTLLQEDGHSVVLVAADGRLLRAAGANGIICINPETSNLSDLDALL